jgi:fluoride exporter
VDRFVWICLAGGAGTGCRYLVGIWCGRALGDAFPFGTLVVNVAGCFCIAAITHVALSTDLVSPTLRAVLTTGFLGGFTTYSAFNLETTKLLAERGWGSALTNLCATVIGCFVAGLLGLAAAKRLVGP